MIRRIDAVLQSDIRPEVAYPLRARLGRAILEVAKWHKGGAEDHGQVELGDLVRRIAATSTHIMQPSEPFDDHWPEQWSEVLADLTKLRSILSNDVDN